MRLPAKQGGCSILEYCEEPLVSLDFKGNPASSIVDAQSTMVIAGGIRQRRAQAVEVCRIHLSWPDCGSCSQGDAKADGGIMGEANASHSEEGDSTGLTDNLRSDQPL